MYLNYKLVLQLKQREKLSQTLGSLPSDVNTLLESLKAALTGAQNLQSGIGGLVGINERLNSILQKVVDNSTFLEQRYSELNKTFGISSISAAKFGDQLETVSKDLGVGGKTAIMYAQNLNKVAAGFIATDKSITGYRKQLFEAQKIMITNLKVSNEAAEGYERYAVTVGKSGKEQLDNQLNLAKVVEDNTDLTGVQRDLTEELGSMSANLQLQYSKIPGSLELAVLKSRALGLSMADLNKTGQSLLNIESSVGEELEYQLLTGRRLLTADGESLTNAYRMATIRGDANEQAELMNKLIEDEGETLKTNLFARQQAAKMLGMDEATLSRAIQKKEILDRLEAESGKDLMSLSGDALIAQAKALGATAEEVKALDLRTTDELILEEMEKMNTNIIQSITGTATGGAAVIVGASQEDLLTITKSMSMFSGILGNETLATIVGTLNNTMTIGQETIALLAELGTAVIKPLRAIGSVINVDDGIIQFNAQDKFMSVNSDTVIAGTDAGGNQALANAMTSNNNGGISDSQINKLANAMANALRGVTIQTDPLYQGNNINGDRFA